MCQDLASRIVCSVVIAVVLSLVRSAFAGDNPPPASPAFTYQGFLNSGGAPYTGTADMHFTLYDSAVDGNQVGQLIGFDTVPVVDGVFSVDLNFGLLAFDGQERWLAIEVGTPSAGGAGPYTALTPRQRIAPAPYALYALSIAPIQPAAISFNNASNQFTGATLDIDSGTLSVDSYNNRVAIGSGAPMANLHVFRGSAGMIPAGNSSLALEGNWSHYLSMIAPDTSETGVLFGRPTSGNPAATAGIVFNNSANPDGLEFRTGGNLTRMVINNTGNVGIGTPNPSTPLHVVRSTGAGPALQLATPGDVPISMSLNTPFHSWTIGQNYPFNTDNFVIREESMNAVRFAIQNGSGRVGINTSSFLDMLTVQGTGTAISAVDNDVQTRLFSSFAYGRGYVGTSTNSPFVLRTNDQDRVIIDQSGQVGIATMSPAHTLSVNGSAGKPGGGSWSTFSDARLKTNVHVLHGALDSLLALRGVTFEYTDPTSINERPGEHIGMIAQEVEQVFPQWVSQSSPEGYRQLAFCGFEALTVEALRDLRTEKDAQIALLQSENRALGAEVAELRKLVAGLLEQEARR